MRLATDPTLAQIPEVSILWVFALVVGGLVWNRVEARRAASLRRSLEERLVLALQTTGLNAWEWRPRDPSAGMDAHALAAHAIGAGSAARHPGGLLERIHEDDRAAFAHAHAALRPEHPDFVTEYRIRSADGGVRHLATRGRASFDADGRLVRLIGVTQDMTARRACGLELQQRRSELAHATRALTAAQLTGSLSHELNQPLAAIVANAHAGIKSLELRAPGPEYMRELLGDISADAARAGRIIQRLRALLRKKAPVIESIEVAPLVEETARLLHTELMLNRVALQHRDVAPGLRVHGDRVQLQQVLINLLLNAADCMSAQPVGERQVRVSAGLDPAGGVWVNIEDCGPGMAPERLATVFEPFRSSKPQGLGLGLSICQAIMELHHGSIRFAANTPRPGLTATLRFPPVAA